MNAPITKDFWTIYNVMVVRKAIWEYLSQEISIVWIAPEFVMYRSGLKKYTFDVILSWGSMWTVKRNSDLESYWKIAKSIPITRERFDFLLKKALVKDHVEYNRTHIDNNPIFTWYLKELWKP